MLSPIPLWILAYLLSMAIMWHILLTIHSTCKHPGQANNCMIISYYSFGQLFLLLNIHFHLTHFCLLSSFARSSLSLHSDSLISCIKDVFRWNIGLNVHVLSHLTISPINAVQWESKRLWVMFNSCTISTNYSLQCLKNGYSGILAN